MALVVYVISKYCLDKNHKNKFDFCGNQINSVLMGWVQMIKLIIIIEIEWKFWKTTCFIDLDGNRFEQFAF